MELIQDSSAKALKPKLLIKDGVVTTTSMALAESFSRTHKDVLRAIDTQLSDLPDGFHPRNFAPMFRDVVVGNGGVRKERYYRLTRDGFTFIAMRFTGARAAQWQVAYIEAFNAMERNLLARNKPIAAGLELIAHDDGIDAPLFNQFIRVFGNRAVARAMVMTYLIEAGAHRVPLHRSVRAIERDLDTRLSRAGVSKAIRHLVSEGLLDRGTEAPQTFEISVVIQVVEQLFAEQGLDIGLLSDNAVRLVH